MQKHTIAVLVENQFGVLCRVAGLFSARGFNIDSLTVGETQDPTVSRMTVVARGDERVVQQITRQLDKLIDVISIEILSPHDTIDRELVMIKVASDASNRNDLMGVVNNFRGKIVDVQEDSMTIEATGTEAKIDAMLELLKSFGLLEVVRTGKIAISRKTSLATPEASVVEKVAAKKSSKSKSAKPAAKGGAKKAKMQAGTDTWM
jgi:acetolactate synthase-1/3 small subunit